MLNFPGVFSALVSRAFQRQNMKSEIITLEVASVFNVKGVPVLRYLNLGVPPRCEEGVDAKDSLIFAVLPVRDE